MSDDRRNIKVSAERFAQLKEEKPEGVNWGYYLTEIRTVDGATQVPNVPVSTLPSDTLEELGYMVGENE